MPKTTKQPKVKVSKSMEAALWESCNKLRGAVEPAEYKHVVLSYLFEICRRPLRAETTGAHGQRVERIC